MHCFLLLASIALLGTVVADAAGPGVSVKDTSDLQALNREYIRSVLESDVGWFDRNLGEDFVCTNRDGSLVDRAAFLKQTAAPITLSNFELHDVAVRVMGDFALIHARTTYMQPDGKTGASRYTDAWARRQGRWVAVSAHITPVR